MLAYDVLRRGLRTSRALSIALAASLTLGAAPRAQETNLPLTGTWKGAATVTNDAAPTTCRYEGGPESAVLKLQSEEAGPRALVRLEIAGTPGSGCPPLQKRYEATNVVVTSSAVSFIDPAGHEWHLGLREGRLVGLVAWKGGGTDDPLAEGYAPPGAAPPLTRLSGEVSFERVAEPAVPGAAAGEASAAAAKGPAATRSRVWPAFIGANIVGLGAFYGVKKATDDTGGGGAATCSPRYCVYGGLDDPCNCDINITSGSSCGQTTNGVPFGGACNDSTLPCQAGLSCNNSICDDKFGRCPF